MFVCNIGAYSNRHIQGISIDGHRILSLSMITVFQESAFPVFTPIVFLTKPAGNELHRSWYRVVFGRIGNDKVDMVAGGYEI